MLEMAFSGTQTAYIFALVCYLTTVELVGKKHRRVATIKRHVQLQARTKLIAIVNQKLCKQIIPTCTHHFIYYHCIYQYCSIYHAFSILPLHLPSSLFLNVYTIATCDQYYIGVDTWLQ